MFEYILLFVITIISILWLFAPKSTEKTEAKTTQKTEINKTKIEVEGNTIETSHSLPPRTLLQEHIVEIASTHKYDDLLVDKLLGVVDEFGGNASSFNAVNVSTILHRLASVPRNKRHLINRKTLYSPQFISLCERVIELLKDNAVGARAVSSMLWSLSKILKISNGGTLYYKTWSEIIHCHDLIQSLGEAAILVMDSFDAQAISNGYYALGQLHYRENLELNTVFTHKISQVIRVYGQEDASFFTPQHVSNILQATASIFTSAKEIPSPDMLLLVTDYGRRILHEFIPQEIATSLFALGKLGYSDNAEFLLDALKMVSTLRTSLFKPVDISNSFLAFGKLLGNCSEHIRRNAVCDRDIRFRRAIDKLFSGPIASHILNNLNDFQLHEIANIVSSHARLNYVDLDFICQVCDHLTKRLSKNQVLQPQDCANIFFALGRICQANRDVYEEIETFAIQVSNTLNIFDKFKLSEFVIFVVGLNIISSLPQAKLKTMLNYDHYNACAIRLLLKTEQNMTNLHEVLTVFTSWSKTMNKSQTISTSPYQVVYRAMYLVKPLHGQFKTNQLSLFLSAVERILLHRKEEKFPELKDELIILMNESVKTLLNSLTNSHIYNVGHFMGVIRAVCSFMDCIGEGPSIYIAQCKLHEIHNYILKNPKEDFVCKIDQKNGRMLLDLFHSHLKQSEFQVKTSELSVLFKISPDTKKQGRGSSYAWAQ